MMSLSKNPFDEPDETSPFANTAAGRRPPASQRPGSSNDYNPFAEKPVNTTTVRASTVLPPPPPSAASSLLPPLPPAPPPYTPSPALEAGAAAELLRRHQELERKAADIHEREHRLTHQGGADARLNNWPPLPKCCPKPCFYQNFDVDISLPHRRLVKIMYYMWIVYSLSLLLNVFFCMAYFISSSETGTVGASAGVSFGFSLLWLLLFVPLAFICWYRPVYKAFRSNSSINFFVFFFVYFAQAITSLIMALGIERSGFVGWVASFTMIGQSGSQKVVGAAMVIMAVIFSAYTAVSVVLLIKIIRTYRGTGASFAQAQKDLAQGVFVGAAAQSAAGQAAPPTRNIS